MKNGKYLQDPDIRAFDLMGYEIDMSGGIIQGVQAVPSTTPVDNAAVPAGALTVSWDDALFATSYDMYVDCGSCLITYQQRDIFATTHTIPAGILVDGPYTIVVTARNWRGFVSTPIHVTVSGGSACDTLDFNADGVTPDSLDIDDYLSVFGGGTCSTGMCGDIDFNNDGVAPDSGDIDAILSVFGGGPC